MFKINHDEAFDEFGMVEEGEYEVVVAKALENVWQTTGTEYMDIQLIIRNDIEQAHKGQWLFYKIWKSKESGEFHSGMINTLAKALNLPNGKQYGSVQELLNDCHLKTCRVKVTHKEYEGKPQVNISSLSQTKFPQCNHQWKDGTPPVNAPKEDDFAGIDGFDSVDDDNIPF